jgi:hypothetical protein
MRSVWVHYNKQTNMIGVTDLTTSRKDLDTVTKLFIKLRSNQKSDIVRTSFKDRLTRKSIRGYKLLEDNHSIAAILLYVFTNNAATQERGVIIIDILSLKRDDDIYEQLLIDHAILDAKEGGCVRITAQALLEDKYMQSVLSKRFNEESPCKFVLNLFTSYV